MNEKYDPPRCKTCPAWYRQDPMEGWCRRHAPRFAPNQEEMDPGDGFWPLVGCNDWCLEHPDHPINRRVLYIPDEKATQEFPHVD